ncbi:hypothetical protein CEXT_459301 [Caerostris extrusa]|uniref:Uncharacterized protein n=1 Tax=Caerostris extrusa TaxID=172846 RepID=A0AAV4QBP0_CAEEX|nr:hypothetical protein CEXT_459301 [Caerostris extrusa]
MALSVSLFANLLDRIPSGQFENDACATTCGFRFSQVTEEVSPPLDPPLLPAAKEGFNYNHCQNPFFFVMADSYPGNEINQLSSTDDDALCPKLYLQQKKGCATISTPVATGCQ